MKQRIKGLLLIGCGKMGGALLRGWLGQGLEADRIRVVEPSDAARTEVGALGIEVSASLDNLARDFLPDIVILAVKPQMMAAVLPGCRRFAGPGVTFVSIAAGLPLDAFEAVLGAETAIVRAMPNTPAAVGRGMSVLCANPPVSADQQALAGDLMAAVGEVAWIADERLMDAVTGVSGSGPAYVFLLVECLTEAGVRAGLDAELAEQLARATVAGAGELVRRSEAPAAELRRNVTSPGGTTQAALDVLMADGAMQDLLIRAVAAAERRGAELAKVAEGGN